MFDSVALNVVISLVFIYLLYSLLATVIQEIIAVHFSIRAKILKRGIHRMLDDDTGNNPLTQSFYNHPLIKYLSENKVYNKPSYLSAQNFSKVVIDLLRGENVEPGSDFAEMIQTALNNKKLAWNGKTINNDTLVYLKSLWADVNGNVEQFSKKLETWYDDTMDRASGWYKKQVQLILFFIGLSIAVVFNVDSIEIAGKLSRDPKLAKQLADNAAIYIETHKELGTHLKNKMQSDSTGVAATKQNEEALDSIIVQSRMLIDSANALVKKDIKSVNQTLGLGWSCSCCTPPRHEKVCIKTNLKWHSLIGWVITAIAISLGAPFWFDLLNKLMKLRASTKQKGK